MSEIYSPGSIAGPPAVFMGPHDNDTTYSIGQAVSSDGSSYVSLVTGNLGCDPATSPTEWALLAAKGQPSGGVEVSEVFVSASSIIITHGLGTLTPIIQGRVLSGATRWYATAVDANTTMISSTGPMSIVLAFLGGLMPAPLAPAITLQPSSAAIDTGGTLLFMANASGSPPPSAQWQMDSGTSGATWTNVSGATSPTYSVQDAGKNGWQYRAVFTNASGFATTSTSTVTAANILTGLVNHWPMDEGAGSTFVDAIAANNLSAGGVTWAGTVPTFGGSNSGAYAALQPAPLAVSTSPFTISFWQRLPTIADGAVIYNTDEGHSGYEAVRILSGKLYFLMFSGSAADIVVSTTSSGVMTAGVRQNILVTYDGSGTAAGVRFYVGGSAMAMSVQTDSLTAPITAPGVRFTTMAEWAGIFGNSTAGSMDSLRIYNRVLSSGDIALIQTGGN